MVKKYKQLFRTRQTKTLNSSSVNEVSRKIESPNYVTEFLADRKKYFPNVNFSLPGNFARFGSAEEYYKKSIENIYKSYPYDGSLKEKYEWHNSSSYLDNYIFEEEYPRTNGHITLGQNWGNSDPSDTVDATGDGDSIYKISSAPQYVSIKGGPNAASNLTYELDAPAESPDYKKKRFKANYYKEIINQKSNLTIDGTTGNSLEFWLKLPENPTTSQTSPAHAYFDLWNGEAITENSYGRILLETVFDVAGGNPDGSYLGDSIFYVSYASGSSGVQRAKIGASTFPTSENVTLSDWNHYAFVMQNSPTGSDHLLLKMYVNGNLIDTVHTGSQISEVTTGSFNANIGAYKTGPTQGLIASGVSNGYGSLSGSSIDEFRFWKSNRNSKQIGENWFKQVAGGANSDFGDHGSKFTGSANPVNLGVYYKFNEGISNLTPLDSVVLDYSGRVSNGTIVNYNSSPAMRSVGSAMVSASAAEREFKDPILYKRNPLVSAYYNEAIQKGLEYDTRNTSAIYDMIPQWILDEDSEKAGLTVKKLTQIIASQFDELQLYTDKIKTFKNINYISGSLSGSINKPLPFANRLLTSKGFPAPELFANADVLATLANRDDEREYERALFDVKNQLYTNIHNNFNIISKSKGTEKSIRNLLRSLGVDNELYSINFYANNAEITLNQSLVPTTIEKNVIDFSHTGSFSALIYQSSASSDSNSATFITGSDTTSGFDRNMGFTMEVESIFPKKPDFENTTGYEKRFFQPLSASLFGMHSAVAADMSNVGDTTWDDEDYANFQVYAVKSPVAIGAREGDEKVHFKLTSLRPADGVSKVFNDLASPVYSDVYDSQRWNFAVKVLPETYPNLGIISGSTGYRIEFHGYNTAGDQVANSFVLTSSISNADGLKFLTKKKRVYVGAHRQNFTGSALYQSNYKVSACRYWALPLEKDEIIAHAIDASNHGLFNPNENAYLFQDFKVNVPKIDTLALNWEFGTITGSDSGGNFEVLDLSSGSYGNRYGGPISNLLEKSHPGRGFGFNENITDCVHKDFLFSYKQQVPDNLDISDTIHILDRDDQFFTTRTQPIKYSLSVEKSMYEVISEEMLNFMAACVNATGLENLIGTNVDKYRSKYKSLEKIRNLFFEKIGNTPDLDKYLEYYKWLDSAISEMIAEIIPMSSGFKDIENVVESHILERSKYQHKFPTMEFKTPDPEGIIKGINELVYDWDTGHAPTPPHGTGEQAVATVTFKSDTVSSANYDALQLWITSVSGVTKKYLFDTDNSAATGTVHGAYIFVQLHGKSGKSSVAQELQAAINHANGHNGGSANSVISMSESGGVLTLTQVVQGASGNNAILAYINLTQTEVSGFAGGYDHNLDQNCPWWNKKALRSEPYLVTGNGGVDYGRQLIHSASLQIFNRDFNKPYRMSLREEGIKTRLNKKSVVLTELKPFDNSRSITFDTRTFVTGSKNCSDDNELKQNIKVKADYQVQLNDGTNTQSKYSSGLVSPYSFYSASLDKPAATGIPTGYQVGSDHLRDYYVDTKDVPMQGPFTEQHVGGHQHRHVNLVFKPVQLNPPTEPRKDVRPEAWYAPITVAGGHIFYSIVNPSYFGSTFTRADFTRETLAKRPVNVKNIKTDTTSITSSYGSVLPIGNYAQNYEIVQIPDRSINSRYFVENNGVPTTPSTSPAVFGLKDYTVPDRGKHASIMVNRFSSPGGPEVNSAGYMDAESETYSVYNALPFRNLTVRQPLRSFLTDHSAFGGYDSVLGAPSASYHKTQRNGAKRIENSEERVYTRNSAGASPDAVVTSSVYDNYWVQHMIPQSELQYSWITASAVSFPFGYSQPDFSNASEAATDIGFVLTSDINSFLIYSDHGVSQLQFISNTIGDYDNRTVAFRSTAGTLKTYKFTDDSGEGATGSSHSDGSSIVVQINGMSSRDAYAAQLLIAINSANGHNAGAPNTVIEAGYGSQVMVLRQSVPGPLAAAVLSTPTWSGAGGTISVTTFSAAGAPTSRRHRMLSTSPGGSVYNSSSANLQPTKIPISFVGLNTHFVNTLNLGTNTITDTSLNTTFVDGGVVPNPPFSSDAVGSVGTGSFLNAINLSRNGAGGYSSWKQVRQSYNPLVRSMHKNNTISLIEEDPITFSNTTLFVPRIVNYTEPPVSFKNKPLLHQFLLDTEERVVLRNTYSNNFETYANSAIDLKTNYKGREAGEEVYDDLKKIYIHNLIPVAQSSIEDLESFKYRETVYPKNKNVGLARTRSRENYTVSSGSSDFNKRLGTSLAFWKDNVADRLRSEAQTTNSQEVLILSGSSYFGLSDFSVWPLDAELPFFDLYFASGAVATTPTNPVDPFYFSPISPSGSLLDINYESRWADVRKNGELSYAGYIYNLLNPNLQGRARKDLMPSSSVSPFRWAIASNKEDYNSLITRGAYEPSASLQYEFPNLVPSGTTDNHVVDDSGDQTFVPSGNLCLIPPYRADVLSERRPWFNSYEEYSEDIRRIAKEYSVIPEFRISDHLLKYHRNGFFADSNDFLDLKGCSLNTTSSAQPTRSGMGSKNNDFFKLYSHTDFLKHFSIFREDHAKNDTAAMTKIRLECHGIKKLLPYQGFYPALRSVQLGSLFSSSFGSEGYITGSAERTISDVTRAGGVDFSGGQERIAALLQPFYAPGIFYNTIKSGVAVSYAVHTGSAAKTTVGSFIPVTDGTSGSFFAGKVIGDSPNYILPFESILDPASHLPVSGTHQIGRNTTPPPTSSIYFTYSQLTGTTAPNKTDGFYLQQNGARGAVKGIVNGGTSSAPPIYFEWLGKSDPYYKLAAHNFFAEVENFFLEKKRPTNFVSRPQNQFKGMKSGNTYYMDVVMRSTDKFISYEVPSGSFKYQPFAKTITDLTTGQQAVVNNYHLLYGDGKSQLPLMNVRGMHYGPPYRTSNLVFGSSGTGSVKYANGHFEDPAYAPHTPPYFYGQAVARLKFTPTDDSGERVYELDEILPNAKVETIYFNENERARQFADYDTYQDQPAYVSQMQISSSVNLFGKLISKKKIFGGHPGPDGKFVPTSYEDPEFGGTNESWVIETKFECPSINMYDMDTDSLGAGSPGDGTGASPGSERFYTKGIWKGFGQPTTATEGIFVEVRESFPGTTDDDGEPFIMANQSLPSREGKGSLLKKCGFQAASKKVGEIASNTTMYEAVVAIPIDSNNNFYKIDPVSFATQLINVNSGDPAVKAGQLKSEIDIQSTSVSDMIEKMKRYYIPPKLDFVLNPSVEPFVMYLFEFSHTFNRQDLSYIWQNLMPDISLTAQREISTIEHSVGSIHQFFSKGTDSSRDEGNGGSPFEDTTRWMVFKVKQRAKNNYNSITTKSEESRGFSDLSIPGSNLVLDIDGERELSYSFNWPYDFCSLVELAKVDAEVTFSDPPTVRKSVTEIKGAGTQIDLTSALTGLNPDPEIPQNTKRLTRTKERAVVGTPVDQFNRNNKKSR